MTNPAYRRYNFLLFSMCGLAGLLYGIDMGLIAAALPYIRATCPFSETQLSSIVAAVMLGCIPGTLCAAWLAEKAGRLASLKITALVFASAVPFICLSGGTFWLMFAGRLLQGAGCGFMGVVAALYVVECAGKEDRGKGSGMLQLVLTVGLVVAALIGLSATLLFGSPDSPEIPLAAKTRAWQTIFWVSIIPSVFLFFGLFTLKESPRWLFKKGRRDEALQSLLMNNDEASARATLAELEKNERAQVVTGAGGTVRESIFQRKYLLPFALGASVIVFNQASGVNSLLNYSVVMMQRAGLAGTTANVADMAIKATIFLVTLLAMSQIDRKGRKFLLTIGTVGLTAGLVAVGTLFLVLERGIVASGPAMGWAILAAFLLFVASFSIGPGVCVWAVMTELMPLRIRAGGVMAAQFLGMGVSYVLAQTYLPWSKAYGESSVFLTLAAVSVLYVATVVFLLPETKGKSLEEIERCFASDDPEARLGGKGCA